MSSATRKKLAFSLQDPKIGNQNSKLTKIQQKEQKKQRKDQKKNNKKTQRTIENNNGIISGFCAVG